MYNIYHDFIIKATKAEIFEAISNPKDLNNWWTKKCSGKPELNAEYNLFFSEKDNWFGKVSICDLNSSFHIKMTKTDEDWRPTSFGFDLEEAKSGTLVKFSHTNWKECNPHFKHTSFCWAILLNGLKQYVEKGIILPFEKRG